MKLFSLFSVKSLSGGASASPKMYGIKIMAQGTSTDGTSSAYDIVSGAETCDIGDFKVGTTVYTSSSDLDKVFNKFKNLNFNFAHYYQPSTLNNKYDTKAYGNILLSSLTSASLKCTCSGIYTVTGSSQAKIEASPCVSFSPRSFISSISSLTLTITEL